MNKTGGGGGGIRGWKPSMLLSIKKDAISYRLLIAAQCISEQSSLSLALIAVHSWYSLRTPLSNILQNG